VTTSPGSTSFLSTWPSAAARTSVSASRARASSSAARAWAWRTRASRTSAPSGRLARACASAAACAERALSRVRLASSRRDWL
jgi:hypothetical protein